MEESGEGDQWRRAVKVMEIVVKVTSEGDQL